MGIKAMAARILAAKVARETNKWATDPVRTQEKVFKKLVSGATATQFGKDHAFQTIHTHSDFVSRVPVRDYEGIKPYVERILAGELHVLWPDKPKYFAKTSGTTSGAKYIPITGDAIAEQVKASRDAILHYIHSTGNTGFVNGKMIFLQGSPELTEKAGIKMGRLSGISAHYVPGYLQKNRLPSWETNCIEDWEAKIEAIITETLGQNMTVIAGIPSWVQMYFERLQEKTGRTVGELFPNFELFIYGGVNFDPYRARFAELIGRPVAEIELFPASEGFFAYQDSRTAEGLLLLLNAGIFYEFIRADEFYQEHPRRYTIGEVETGINYVMILSTNAGLWAYNLGDTVRFVSLEPFRIVVTGRIAHFISAFGEHVIAKEVEEAIREAQEKTGARVNEFTVAPMISAPRGELPYHEWLIEFEQEPPNFEEFKNVLDHALQRQNSYYLDLIKGKILQPLKITTIGKDGFQQYMKAVGKLGGQNKVQRLANDRSVADKLSLYVA